MASTPEQSFAGAGCYRHVELVANREAHDGIAGKVAARRDPCAGATRRIPELDFRRCHAEESMRVALDRRAGRFRPVPASATLRGWGIALA